MTRRQLELDYIIAKSTSGVKVPTNRISWYYFICSIHQSLFFGFYLFSILFYLYTLFFSDSIPVNKTDRCFEYMNTFETFCLKSSIVDQLAKALRFSNLMMAFVGYLVGQLVLSLLCGPLFNSTYTKHLCSVVTLYLMWMICMVYTPGGECHLPLKDKINYQQASHAIEFNCLNSYLTWENDDNDDTRSAHFHFLLSSPYYSSNIKIGSLIMVYFVIHTLFLNFFNTTQVLNLFDNLPREFYIPYFIHTRYCRLKLLIHNCFHICPDTTFPFKTKLY